jgi:hypothetical protein
MKEGDSFSISFHEGKVDFPYNLKVHVIKIKNDTSKNYAYHFVALNKDNYGNPNIKFIAAFFAALDYLQNDANFSGITSESILPGENQEEIYFQRMIYINNPIFDSLLITGYIGEDEVVINSLSCPPQRKDEMEL